MTAFPSLVIGTVKSQTYPCREGEIIYCGLVHLTKPDEKSVKCWDHPATLQECLNSAKGFDPALITLLEKGTDIKVYNQIFRPSVPSFAKGKAVLLGDSTHFMLQVHGQGTSASIEYTAALGVLPNGVISPGMKARLGLF